MQLFHVFPRLPDSSSESSPSKDKSNTPVSADSTDKILGENLTEKVTVSYLPLFVANMS